jgi:hypothetical protein
MNYKQNVFFGKKQKSIIYQKPFSQTSLEKLPIDKPYRGFYTTKRDIKEFQVANKDFIFIFVYSNRPDSNRLLDLWKTKTGKGKLGKKDPMIPHNLMCSMVVPASSYCSFQKKIISAFFHVEKEREKD